MSSDGSTRLAMAEERLAALERLVADKFGIPVFGSREYLIEHGFALTDESQAAARQVLADAEERRARIDWPAVRQQIGMPAEGSPSPITDADRLAKLEHRIAWLERHLDPPASTEV